MRYHHDINSDFKCIHCRSYISAGIVLAGVNNRNHCPYCLWSRHMDLFQAGDRLSACKSPMRPVGLTMKRSRNKYATISRGELMLIHQCLECTAISINRIAADDVPEILMEIFEISLSAPSFLREQIAKSAINLLGEESIDLLYRQLYGRKFEPALVQVAV